MKSAFGASVLPVAVLFIACAAPVRDARGIAIAHGAPVAPRPSVAFQADLGVAPRAPGSLPFSARLYGRAGDASDSAPSERYRLDAFGFPSAIVASWLWSDGRWTLVRHDRREVNVGEGFALGDEDSPVRIPDIRVVLGVLAGEPLPGYPGIDTPIADGHGSVRWSRANERWEARIDPVTGLCREVRSGSLTLRYARHRLREGVVIPEMIEVVSGEGDTLLSLSVREWVSPPVWKRNPFDLVVPAGYERK